MRVSSWVWKRIISCIKVGAMKIHLTQASIYNTGGGSNSMYREGGPRIVLVGHPSTRTTLRPPEMGCRQWTKGHRHWAGQSEARSYGTGGDCRIWWRTMAWPLASCPTCGKTITFHVHINRTQWDDPKTLPTGPLSRRFVPLASRRLTAMTIFMIAVAINSFHDG